MYNHYNLFDESIILPPLFTHAAVMFAALFNHRINDESSKNKKKYMCPKCVNADLLRTGGCKMKKTCVFYERRASSLVGPRDDSISDCFSPWVFCVWKPVLTYPCAHSVAHSLSHPLTFIPLTSSTFSFTTRARGSQRLSILHGCHEAEERQHVLCAGDTPQQLPHRMAQETGESTMLLWPGCGR